MDVLLNILTEPVSRTPGVSITFMILSFVLLLYRHSFVTDEASGDDSKRSLPRILFPVRLFPLPVFPRRTTVSSFPMGSYKGNRVKTLLKFFVFK